MYNGVGGKNKKTYIIGEGVGEGRFLPIVSIKILETKSSDEKG